MIYIYIMEIPHTNEGIVLTNLIEFSKIYIEKRRRRYRRNCFRRIILRNREYDCYLKRFILLFFCIIILYIARVLHEHMHCDHPPSILLPLFYLFGSLLLSNDRQTLFYLMEVGNPWINSFLNGLELFQISLAQFCFRIYRFCFLDVKHSLDIFHDRP